MSVNSSFSEDSLLHPNFSFINSNLPFGMHCLITSPSSLIFTTFLITNILLLVPLCTFILYLGLQRWRQQRSTSTAAMTSHSDTFTYHMVTMELFGVLGCILCRCGIYSDDLNLLTAGFCLWTFTWFGETFFHTLTCVERYLAVVHPITYLGLRRERGIRIRNVSIGCVWLLYFGGASLVISENLTLIAEFSVLVICLIVIFFCSISVLYVLIRPGPGEQGGDRERVDQSKQRAFYTIMAILGILLLRCFWNLFWVVLNVSSKSSDCVLMISGVWLTLFCKLVFPLLFLLRAGILVFRKSNTK